MWGYTTHFAATNFRKEGKMKKALQKGLIILVLLVIWASGCGVETEIEEIGELEEVIITEKEWGDAPDFTLPDLEGNSLTLSDFKGRVIILNFWATWCPPCRKEIPDFVELYEKYKDEGLLIIGVNLDRGDSRTVKQFSKNYKINYPIVLGNVNVTQDYGGIRGIPTTFVIDRKGNIKKKYVGYRPKATFEGVVKILLEIL
ncbi:Thiol-disulfide oxidoreductase ResA [subsurface metagenome]